jgi:8-oxo-dGTP pyrophosphatase MutT (NUDIX family)
MRDAATIMLVRDGDEGLEVFMLRRNLQSDFVGGAYVFPGGAVDPADRHADLEKVSVGRLDHDASTLLALDPPAGGLAYWVAGIRESFEEAGVLLAYGDDGLIVDFRDPEVEARFKAHRAAVDSGARRLVDVCVEEGLQLAVDRVHYFSHWITPKGPTRRYDTRFFVARAPEWQSPLHDDRETIANTWIRPDEAIERSRRGELDLILPTVRNLKAIARFDTASALLTAAAAIEEVPTVIPRVVKDSDGLRILLPGDPGYDDAGDDGAPAGTPLSGLAGGPVASEG